MKEGLPFFLTSGRHTVKNGLPLQFFNQAGKVADVAADAVQTVDHNGLEFPVLGRSHHLFEVRAVQVAAGKALVLKDNGMFRGSIAVVSADIFAAEVDLISDALTLAGVAGLAGINCNGVGSFGHKILLSCCPVAVDAAMMWLQEHFWWWVWARRILHLSPRS